jgi:hypothetical protein
LAIRQTFTSSESFSGFPKPVESLQRLVRPLCHAIFAEDGYRQPKARPQSRKRKEYASQLEAQPPLAPSALCQGGKRRTPHLPGTVGSRRDTRRRQPKAKESRAIPCAAKRQKMLPLPLQTSSPSKLRVR